VVVVAVVGAVESGRPARAGTAKASDQLALGLVRYENT
jgi:hypothetical protein